MGQEELIREFQRLFESDDLTTKIELLDLFIQCYFDLMINHRNDPVYLRADKDAKIVLQMMFSKLINLRKIVEGVNYKNREGRTLLRPIIDPTIVTSLLRTVYETVCAFHLVYRATDSMEKKEILYNLWVVSGLKYRQKFSSITKSEEGQKKFRKEAVQIENYIKEIKETQLFQKLEKKDQKKILDKIRDKDYKIKIEGNMVRFLTWQEISREFQLKVDIFGEMYTYFSLYSHPSHVSVFQFEEMFGNDGETFKALTKSNLRFCLPLCSIFLADFIALFPQTRVTYENRRDIDQIALNFHNNLLRGEEYSINDAWKKLG